MKTYTLAVEHMQKLLEVATGVPAAETHALLGRDLGSLTAEGYVGTFVKTSAADRFRGMVKSVGGMLDTGQDNLRQLERLLAADQSGDVVGTVEINNYTRGLSVQGRNGVVLGAEYDRETGIYTVSQLTPNHRSGSGGWGNPDKREVGKLSLADDSFTPTAEVQVPAAAAPAQPGAGHAGVQAARKAASAADVGAARGGKK